VQLFGPSRIRVQFAQKAQNKTAKLQRLRLVTIGEPDLSQVLEAPVVRDIGWRDVTMVIEKGHGLSELEVEFLARTGREQIIFG
jgi:hypothetical protein